jgi:hypothetical protein
MSTDTFDPGAQDEELKERRTAAARLAHAEDEDIKWLMSSKRGRRIVWRLVANAGVYRSTFNENPLTFAHQEGQRNGGLAVLAMVLRACPDLHNLMTLENAKTV